MKPAKKNAVSKIDGIETRPACEKDCPPVSQEDVADAFQRLRERANQGDARAREVLKKYLDSHPELWSRFGNMARHAELALIGVTSGGEWLTTEAIQREADRMRLELAGPAPTPLEKMAVERIVITWLQLQHTELRFLQSQTDLGWAKYWLRRMELADKLYRAAIGSLVVIRDLLPADTPATTPATTPVVADARTEARKLEMDGTVEMLIPIEVFADNGLGANRIARLAAFPDNALRFAGDDQVKVRPKLNGRHRLKNLLANNGN